MLKKAKETRRKKYKYAKYQEAIDLMLVLDKILASHPNYSLEKWVQYARNFGDTEAEKMYYESNAKRLITTWGGNVNDYSARTWNGLIGTYYAKRWQLWLDSKKDKNKIDLRAWEEEWITSPYKDESTPFDNPIDEIKKVINQ